MQNTKIVLTRPEKESKHWLDGLKGAGFDVVNWPLIEIEHLNPNQACEEILSNLDTFSAIAFVSSSAVDHFVSSVLNFKKLTHPERFLWPNLKYWATGHGTVQALLRAGVDENNICMPAKNAAQFDSIELWRVVKDSLTESDLVLFVRGLNEEDHQALNKEQNSSYQPISHNQNLEPPTGSNWLIWQLKQQNIQVQSIEVYRRKIPNWSDVQKLDAIEALKNKAIWIFSSSLAIENLAILLPLEDCSRGFAVATHERIALKAKEVGWGVVCVSRPTIVDIIKSLELIHIN